MYQAFGLWTRLCRRLGSRPVQYHRRLYGPFLQRGSRNTSFRGSAGKNSTPFAGSPVRVGALQIALAVTLGLTGINYRGVRVTARVQDFTMNGKIGIAVIFILAGIAAGEWESATTFSAQCLWRYLPPVFSR